MASRDALSFDEIEAQKVRVRSSISYLFDNISLLNAFIQFMEGASDYQSNSHLYLRNLSTYQEGDETIAELIEHGFLIKDKDFYRIPGNDLIKTLQKVMDKVTIALKPNKETIIDRTFLKTVIDNNFASGTESGPAISCKQVIKLKSSLELCRKRISRVQEA